jgi:predicted CXXCH cytochrome family protein
MLHPGGVQALSRQQRRTIGIAALAIVALICAAAAFFLLRSKPSPSASTHAPQSAYVDGAECASCHQEIAATYAKTGMGRSFFKPTLTNVVENYTHANTLDHKPSGLHYTMLQRNGEFFQRRSQLGFDGKETGVMEERVDYVIGSGNHSRTYLHRAADGQLIELPVSWYTGAGGSWAMSPGYDRKSQSDFSRAITPECMFCHNGYPSGDVGLEPDIDRSIFPAKLPEGIDCQRCHGPGRAHVEAARSGHATPELLRSTIVNPASLSRERQLEVCMQCHLEPTHHDPNEERLFNREIFSYRSGEPLSDYKLYFDRADLPNDDTFEIAHAAYRLRKSACFRNSQMTCLTCHDPHDIPRGQEAIAHYTEVCLNCHRQVAHTVALPAASNCLTCHMAKRRTDDAVHVVMTDHYIRRYEPKRNLLAPIAETTTQETSLTKVALYYPAQPPQTPAAEIAIAEAQVNDDGIARLQALLQRYQPDAPEPYLALARAYERKGDNAEVAHWSQQALAQRKDFRPAIAELVPALFAIHQDAQAIQVLEQAVERYPTDDLLLSDLGNAYLREGETTQAAAMLERAVQANPDRPESHNLLGVIAMQQGDATAAEREFREALRCRAGFAEAGDHLGSLLTDKQRYPEAAFYFEKAISADAENAAAHHHLGRLLVLMDQIPKAIAELREAARLAPEDFQTHADLADLFAATGHTTEALAEYARVLQLKPGQPEAHLGMGMALLSQHKAAEARPHLEAAAHSSDDKAAQAAIRLLNQITH